MFHIKSNFNQIMTAINDNRNDKYFFCFFLFGYPGWGVTWTLTNHPTMCCDGLYSKVTIGSWPD